MLFNLILKNSWNIGSTSNQCTSLNPLLTENAVIVTFMTKLYASKVVYSVTPHCTFWKEWPIKIKYQMQNYNHNTELLTSWYRYDNGYYNYLSASTTQVVPLTKKIKYCIFVQYIMHPAAFWMPLSVGNFTVSTPQRESIN